MTDSTTYIWATVCEPLTIKKDTTKLKPCPFCGSIEIYTYEPTMYEMGNDASVNCENPICEAEVRGRTLKEAIAKWNRRVKE